MSEFVSHIATIEVPVRNLEKSIAFYTEILGVEICFKGNKNAMLSFKKQGVPTIYLVETDDMQELSFKNTNTKIEHSLIDFYTPLLTNFYDWLKEKGIKVGPLNINDSGFGGFGFKDPDENVLSATNILHAGQ